MNEYNILDHKSLTFLAPQQFDKDPNKGDLIIVNGESYVVIESGFPSNIGPCFFVWPAKLSFPLDFMANSILFDFLKNHLIGLLIEVTNNRGEIIVGKVVDLYPDVTFKIYPNYSSKEMSYNYYPVDCISKVKLLPLDNDKHSTPIDISLDQYPKIEVTK